LSVASVRAFLARQRLALWSAGILVVSLLLIGGLLLAVLEATLRREVDEALMLRAQHVEDGILPRPGGVLSPSDIRAGLSDVAGVDEFTAPGIYVQIVDGAGARLATSANLVDGRLPVPADQMEGVLSGVESYVTVRVDQERIRLLGRPIRYDGRPVGAILVGESLHLLDVALRDLRRLLGMAILMAVALALVGGWWLRRQAMRPVSDLTRVAGDIAATGRFEERVVVPSTRDELRDLAVTFNSMLARLERTLHRQRDFLADAAHELRGPLTVIRANLDLLQMDVSDVEKRQSAAEATDEVKRMTRLVADLLFLSAEDAHERLECQTVSLDNLVTAAAERARVLLPAADSVTVLANDPTTVQGDHDRLAQMLWNLVENAVNHSGPGSSISLSLRNRGCLAEVVVSDNGVGIPPEHLPHLFERFYRVDRARRHDPGGAGLGLAIVRQVAEAHGGQATVRSQAGTGTTVSVTLPVTPG
jgi:signal transduction histidine kinase